jgi:hypothetical protein
MCSGMSELNPRRSSNSRTSSRPPSEVARSSLLVPGVGTIFAIGLGAAALLGLGGAAAGAGVGEASELAADTGVPKDDVFFYRQLLKRGDSLVVASVDIEDQAAAVRAVFEQHGAEDIDAARKKLQSAA